MTDITELARERLKEKFDAWFEREYKHLESSKYTDAVPHIKYGFWTAYQAGGAELVEALEKAQAQSSKWLEAYHKAVSIGARYEEHIAELESFRTAYMEWSDKTDWVRTDRRFDVVKPLGKHLADVLKAYIEHLESRTVTVKLPSLNPEMFNEDVMFGYRKAQKEAVDFCAAAGIKVEAE